MGRESRGPESAREHRDLLSGASRSCPDMSNTGDILCQE